MNDNIYLSILSLGCFVLSIIIFIDAVYSYQHSRHITFDYRFRWFAWMKKYQILPSKHPVLVVLKIISAFIFLIFALILASFLFIEF